MHSNNYNNNNMAALNGKTGSFHPPQQQQQQQQPPLMPHMAQNQQGPLQLQQHHFQNQQQQQQPPLRYHQDLVNNNPSRGSVTSSANSTTGGGLHQVQLPAVHPPAIPPSVSSMNGSNKQEQRLTHEQFRAALQMVVSHGDPRDNLDNFVKIGEGSTGTVWIAVERNTSKFACYKLTSNHLRKKLITILDIFFSS
jgi:hypothetical protein